MNYNESLQAKNSRIQTLIGKVSNLPERGSTAPDDILVQLMDGTITTIIDNSITLVGDYVFRNYTNLATVNFPMCTSIGSSAFENCTNLSTVSFSKCTTIGKYAFLNCTNLSTVSFPACTTISWCAFERCTSLTTVNFPVCEAIKGYAFENCTNLSTVSFSKCTTISSNAFNGCYRLKSLYLMSPSLCLLSNSNAFNSTPFGGYSEYFTGVPCIYVPASLVDAYKSATNWIYFSSLFKGV